MERLFLLRSMLIVVGGKEWTEYERESSRGESAIWKVRAEVSVAGGTRVSGRQGAGPAKQGTNESR